MLPIFPRRAFAYTSHIWQSQSNVLSNHSHVLMCLPDSYVCRYNVVVLLPVFSYVKYFCSKLGFIIPFQYYYLLFHSLVLSSSEWKHCPHSLLCPLCLYLELFICPAFNRFETMQWFWHDIALLNKITLASLAHPCEPLLSILWIIYGNIHPTPQPSGTMWHSQWDSQ